MWRSETTSVLVASSLPVATETAEPTERPRHDRRTVRRSGAMVLAAAIAVLGMTSVLPPATAAASAQTRTQTLIHNLAWAQPVGTHGCTNGSSSYTFTQGSRTYYSCGSAWCAIFAAWVWHHADPYVYTDYLNWNASSFETYGSTSHFGTISSVPHMGDAVVFWSGPDPAHAKPAMPANTPPNTIEHVGIVYSVNSNGTITTVEGNANDMVWHATYPQTPGKAAPSGTGWIVKEYVSFALSGNPCMPGVPC